MGLRRPRESDLYPNPKSGSGPRIEWLLEPVDATQVPPKLAGVRTMFSAFHHFRPDAARAILTDAFERRRPICIFESGSGTLLGLAAMLGVPLAVLALMPLARPFRWAHLLFTYLVPLTPLIVLWDGIVSMLRIYSPEQMQKLTEDSRHLTISGSSGKSRSAEFQMGCRTWLDGHFRKVHTYF